ncbi:MAG: SDR family oxidoreductase [Planctomycetota bacterium]|jgi:NAD dependent epimerase/dehydratase family enzyme/ligand-binding SRPBCC domain-containing protein
MKTFEIRTRVAVPPGQAWAWHARPGAFERLTPPWERVEVVRPLSGLADGAEMELRVGTPLGRRRWVARLRDVRPGASFVDEQVEGPFRHWVHEHRFESDGHGGTWMTDRITYEPPLGALGAWFANGLIRRKLERVFRARHERVAADLAAGAAERTLRVAVTGAGGLVGLRLVARLRTLGHEVIRLVRRSPRASDEVQWFPEEANAMIPALEGVDAVVHLAGRNIADGRWTKRAKRAIRDSRVDGTANLVSSLLLLGRRPSAFIGASAVGYYGHRPDEACTEQSEPGTGFLSEVCRAWEAAAAPLAGAGVRLAHLRIGVVLAAEGGALAKMLPWIAADDLVEVIVRSLHDERYTGPINCVAPEASDNRALTKALGRVLRRPTIAPLPGFVVKLLFGEMGQRLLLEGARVVPNRLQQLEFEFRYPDLESALRFELGRPAAEPSSESGRLSRAVTKRLPAPGMKH